MIKFILLLLLCKIPYTGIIEKQVDCNLIEKNNFYNEHGKYVYTQYIYYNWDPQLKRNIVIDYVLADDELTSIFKEGEFFYQRVKKRPHTYKIRSLHYRESWSQIDPERINKKCLHESLREKFDSYQKIYYQDIFVPPL